MTGRTERPPAERARTNPCGACAKTNVAPPGHLRYRMGASARLRTVALLGALAAVLLVASPGLSVADPPVGAMRPAIAPSLGPTWSNGVVQISFPQDTPAFTLASVSDPRVRSVHELTGVAEVDPAGNATAFASFAGPNASWAFRAIAAGPGTEVRASAVLSVAPGKGVWDSDAGERPAEDTGYGNVSVNVSYYLNASTGIDPNTVAFTVNVSAWPWVDASNDSLGLGILTVATNETSIAAGASGHAIQAVRNDSGAPVSVLWWSPVASVRYGNGSVAASPVGTYRAFAPGGLNSTVRLIFGSVEGGYEALSYDPWVRLYPSAFGPAELPAWVFTPGTGAVLASAGAVTAILALVARRRRRTPPGEEL